MNLKEFFETLPKEGWFLNSSGQIRKKGKVVACPISSLKDGFNANQYYWVSKSLGLSSVLTEKILRASDNTIFEIYQRSAFEHFDAVENIVELRQRLLKHCGLKENLFSGTV